MTWCVIPRARSWACALAIGSPLVQAQVQDLAACLRADHVSPPSGTQVFGRVQPVQYGRDEVSCWIEAHEIHEGNWVAVDVRDVILAARSPLPGAAALPLFAIADRSYLKDQPLLLVGSGVDLRALTQACLELRRQGFAQVRVLLGGVRNWRRTQGVDLLTPREAWLGSADGQWRIAAVGLSPAQVTGLPLEPLLQLPGHTDGRTLGQALADLDQRSPSQRPSQWLVVAADMQAQQALLVQWRQDGRYEQQAKRPLAWLEGGWEAYRAYLDQQQHSAAHAGRPLPRLCGS